MAFPSVHSAELNPVSTSPRLSRWTWILPFFIAHLGTWLSIWFKTDPGASLWYLPTAFGIVMAYWWGPRVLLGVYLNAVVCAPLWDLPWQWSFLYALPETVEVGLSWLFFIRIARGKYWLPNLKSVGSFLLFGSLMPTVIANSYLVLQLYLLNDIPLGAIWNNWRVLISADLATQFAFAVPVIVLFTHSMMERGWTEAKGHILQLPLLPDGRNTSLDRALILATFVGTLITISLFPVHDMRVLYGFLMIGIAIRYGVKMAILGSSWIGLLALLLPLTLKGNLGLATATYDEFLATNFDILFLCGVTLVTGRAISDLFIEVADHKRSEESLQKLEDKYRTLVEHIPPIIYISDPDQHIGVTYVSPRIQSMGFTPEEWVADPELWFRQIHPDDQKRVRDEIEATKTSNKPFRSEYRIAARDGRMRWFLDETVDVFDNRGNIVFRQGFMLDITERKHAEETLSSREQYLELLNGLTRAILLSDDLDSIMQTLAFEMKKIIDADDCYILRWNEEKQLPIPVATTATLDFPFTDSAVKERELGIAASIMRGGRVIAVDDMNNSPYINIETARRYPAHSMIAIPLIAGNQKLGASLIAFNSHHSFTQEELDRAEQAGHQVALALLELQQDLEIRRTLKESHALAEIGRALSETERVGTDKVLQLIVDSARDLIQQAEGSVIHLLDAEEGALVPRAISGLNAGTEMIERPKMRSGEGVAGQVIRTGETINVGDINASPLFLIKEAPPTFRSLMVAAVRSGEQPVGTISVQSNKLNAFSASDAGLLNALSIQAAIALENTRLFEATQQSLKEINALYRTSQGLASSLDTDELIEEVVNLLQQNFGYYHTQIYLMDASDGDLVLKSGSGEIGARLLKEAFHLPRGTGIVGHVVETATPFVTNHVNDVMFFFRNALLPDTQSELAVPIMVNGKVMGVIDIQDKPPRRLTDNDLQLVAAVADQLSVSLQKAGLYTNLQTALRQEQTIRSQLVQSERLALVGRLLASVSHELNNPLQAIQNALFLLKEETGLSSQGHQDLDIVLSEAERMAALIERLRSAYRPVQITDFCPLQLNNLIEDVHALIGTHMRHKSIAFEFLPDADLPPVLGISDQLRQVVLNLFLNGVEAMQSGGHLTVQTYNLTGQGEILLTVKDTGPGIDPEILPEIFDAFITNKQTGTGLGLTITHDIIEQHHGRIEAKNDPEGGAIFHIWLPVYGEGGQ